MFLEEEAQGGVRQGEEQVVVGIEGVGVAGEAVGEQLQLVVGTFGDMDSHSTESVLQMIRTLLQVRIAGHGHYKVEMAVHELLALAGNYLLYTFYVFDRCLVARVGNARVPVLLLVQQR